MFRKQDKNRYLIAGLGNPGRNYQFSRHNIGFEALDCISKEYGIRVLRARFSSLSGEGRIGGVNAVLLKPMTFMNLSGKAVAAAAAYYMIPPERILVICDDIALPPGSIRIRAKGSSGGQKGLLSIEDMLGSSDFMRIRIGIGNPVDMDLPDYVLSNPTFSERQKITERFGDVTKAVEMILQGDMEGAQSRYNRAGNGC